MTSGGQIAMRGLLLQTLAALCEAIHDDDDWVSLSLEPNTPLDKTDFVWAYADGNSRAVQIKSSRSQLSKPDCSRWAAALKSDNPDASSWVLQLYGPVSGPLSTVRELDGVEVPTPRPLDIAGQLANAAHQLERYLRKIGIGTIPVELRELIVLAIVAKLSELSASPLTLDRRDLDEMLRNWILQAYPQAAQQLLLENCVATASWVFFPWIGREMHFSDRFSVESTIVAIDFTLANLGSCAALIEWVMLDIRQGDATWRYVPILECSAEKLVAASGVYTADVGSTPSKPKVVPSGGAVEVCIMFKSVGNDVRFAKGPLPAGRFSLKVLGKFHGMDYPREMLSTSFARTVDESKTDPRKMMLATPLFNYDVATGSSD